MFSATAFLSFILVSSLVFASQLEARKALGAAFTADSAIDISSIYAAAKSANQKSVASYVTDPEAKKKVNVYADWQDLEGVSAYHFFADMDVDCDGPAYQCAGNSDGQFETSFGHLDATKTPYYVLPLSLSEKFKKTIKPNSLGAIICNGNMFFGIFGDQNGAEPQEVIGEASLLLAQACFPEDKISGNNGHDPSDVLYIVFGTQVPDGVSDKTVSLPALKALGDKQVLLLQTALLGSSGNDDKDKPPSSSSSTGSNNKTTTTTTTTTTKTASPADSNKSGSNSGKKLSSVSSNTTSSQCSKKSRRSKRSRRSEQHHSRNKRRLSHS